MVGDGSDKRRGAAAAVLRGGVPVDQLYEKVTGAAAVTEPAPTAAADE